MRKTKRPIDGPLQGPGVASRAARFTTQDVTRAAYTLLCCNCFSAELIHGFSPTRRWPVLQILVVLTSAAPWLGLSHARAAPHASGHFNYQPCHLVR